MDSDIRYVAGAGTLLGDGTVWLLVGAVPDAAALDRLWSAVTGPEPRSDRLRDELESVGVDDWVLLRPGHEPVASGAGSASRADDLVTLGVGLDASGPEWPLTGGMVRAAIARVHVPVTAAAGIIDGIPAAILAGAAPPPVPKVTAGPAAGDETVLRPRHAESPAARDGQTVHRPSSVSPATPGHLRQPTHETVLAVRCPVGHLTPAHIPACRSCQAPVPPQTPQRVPRPRLGGLRLPDGDVVPLDRGVVLGRKPAPVPGGEDWPHLVPLPPGETFLSRVHLQIELDGWLVVARDLGSRAGTTLKVPGRAPERIRAHEAYVLEPGHALDLADVYEVVFEVTT